MKITYLVVIAFLFSSCKKMDQDAALTGQWEWYKTTGGLGGINQTPQNSGLSWQLNLHSDHTFSQTGDLFPAGNGTYTLTEDMDAGMRRKFVHMSCNGRTSTYNYIFNSRGDSLRLDENIQADGLSYFLVRE